ncbi:unnamed protein product, partial [Candidula unifasciata]
MTKDSSVRLSFHCCVFMIYSMSFLYDFIAMDSWDYSYMGRLKFATFWNGLLHVLYSAVCVVVDIQDRMVAACPSQGSVRRLQCARDTFHTAIIFPFGTFCVLSFWGLYFKDRELVYPQRLDSDLTCSIIFIIKHSLTFIFTLCDKILVHHRYPPFLTGICVSECFPLFYCIWVYPFMRYLDIPARFMVILFGFVPIAIFHVIGKYITSFIW